MQKWVYTLQRRKLSEVNSWLILIYVITFLLILLLFFRQQNWATKSTDLHLNLSICFKDIKPSEWIKIKKKKRRKKRGRDNSLKYDLGLNLFQRSSQVLNFSLWLLGRSFWFFCQRKMDGWMARSTVLIWKNTQRQKH